MLYEKGRQYEHILTHANIHVTYVYIYIHRKMQIYMFENGNTAKRICKRNMQEEHANTSEQLQKTS
jgi:hypothetical protein